MTVYQLTLEADSPPNIMIGQNIHGAEVVEMKIISSKLMSAAELAVKHGLSVNTIRGRLKDFNQGTRGKHLYDPVIAKDLLSEKRSRGKSGAGRKN